MHPVVEKAEAFILEKRLLRPGQRVLVAVSGGLDSAVLLNVLHQLAAGRRWHLTIGHFNHQLRGAASDADEKLVRKMARALKAPILVGRADVKKFAVRDGISIEMAARKLRHDFLAQAARKRDISTIALAHHADDQLELFFLRIFRGAGSDGLAGMNATGPSPSDPKVALVRPLLDQPKAALLEFAGQTGIEFSEDASNARIDIQRNRIRHELIPLLRDRYQPALARAIFRVMDIVGAEADFARAAAVSWLGGIFPASVESATLRMVGRGSRRAGAACGERLGGSLALPKCETSGLGDPRGARDFDGLAVAVQRRALMLQLFEMKEPVDFELIERLRKSPNQAFIVSPGCSVSRDGFGRIHLEIQKSAPAVFDAQNLEVPLSHIKGRGRFNDLNFSWAILDKPGMKFVRRPNVEHFDLGKIGSKIKLRYWMAGDRFQPSGLRAAAKLQDLFTNAKVSSDDRRRRVVAVTAGEEIFWVEGLRIGERFKLEQKTLRRLEWKWRR